ncbi:hypothetical protein TRICHSKD4_2157 [Roseibium sp. TrichSKD4]|nr:hypothetical protein TRICHSKD4_2157 [Roseibium sp. TrichSKD4]
MSQKHPDNQADNKRALAETDLARLCRLGSTIYERQEVSRK